ncbi:hypothetical protein E3Q18_01724 [Wallemia mellicola]|uniref:Mitochondrial carrier n=1 Tax=Wallemia mellicola TaxID=1708541 RepID=A0A4T0MTU8_9BASI|nr:hypothetical protein E3Q23_01222 [Wallemia mellicola]TIB86256.1 hypothetical protein E3Q19_03967 [Wallemia mellicola]TIB99236.1 hypothetical protein E3Q18_01724 [Wallemia mellicola]TIC31295.1 hypothetical protein E3Q10_01753 [Wallemia mellicola]TIC72459.1 hypothetical protein E3Q00_03978 [Wallemia mellicola]
MSSLRKNYITNKPNGWTFSDIPSNPSTSLERFPNSSANEASTIVKQLVATSLLQFGATSFSMPFEVGKLLLQVQYTPKNRQHQQSEQELIESEESDDDKDDSNYFRFQDDELNVQRSQLKQSKPPISKDVDGYLNQRPSYLIPLQVDGGVWRMMRALTKSSEGFFALWKGTLTSCIFDIAFSTLQPLALSSLSAIFLPSNTLSFLPIHQLPHPFKPLSVHVLAHTLTSIALSPLDLVRTRMIVQATSTTSSNVSRRAYSGPIDALRKISSQEGGWQSMWTHPNLLFPTIVESSLKSLLQLCGPLIIERLLGVSIDSRPATYAICELLWSIGSMTLSLPLETVRRRLQIQDRSLVKMPQAGKFTPCVETRPIPSAGIVETIYRIVTEETSESTDSRWAGFKSLFRGFTMGTSASSLVFILGMFGGVDAAEGWTEI